MVNDDQGDGFEDLLDKLQEKDALFYTMGGGTPETGVAIFPRLLNDADFEVACLKMMSEQQALPPLPEKPTNTSLRDKRRGNIQRGD